ncbi:MAG: hypothetical protein NC299_13100 [Lachnospiraceae bacterium]|nr:hypothetical protein [Lachnospiraceae bacterium]MCM1276275.1 hypothetical protein [Lachnospiraceae bacterium]
MPRCLWSAIWSVGLKMILPALFGCLCGSMNNVFVHISSQNIGNEMRKDCFRRIMALSFPQLDGLGTGSVVTRVTPVCGGDHGVLSGKGEPAVLEAAKSAGYHKLDNAGGYFGDTRH